MTPTPETLSPLCKSLFDYMSYLDYEGLNWDEEEALEALAPVIELERACQRALKWALVSRVVWRLSHIGLYDGVYAGEFEGIGYKLVYDVAEYELRFGHGAYLPDEEDWMMEHAEVVALAPDEPKA